MARHLATAALTESKSANAFRVLNEKRPGHAPGPLSSEAVNQGRGSDGPAELVRAAQAALLNFSTGRFTRAVIGAMACSVSLIDASVNLPLSDIAFSSAWRAMLDCRSMASFSDFTLPRV